MSSELYHTIEAIGREKGIDTDVIVEALEEAYAAATRKYYRSKQDYGARFDPKSGAFQVFAKQEGIPSFVWYLDFKACRAKYRAAMETKIQALLGACARRSSELPETSQLALVAALTLPARASQ